MRVIDDLDQMHLEQETILTIGAFDGLHRGHQALIAAVVERARASGRLAALMTFHPHPAVVLAPDRAPPYLTTPGTKIALLEGTGIDLVVLVPFDRRIANTCAEDFMERVWERLHLRELWVGADFALGCDRSGDVARLREIGGTLGYRVHVMPPVLDDGQPISSTRIRRLLQQGDVEEAGRLLGRYASLSGEVVTGARRGHNLGFPTANLEVRSERAVPADGVYAVCAVLGTERYPAIANVGVRPSFDNGQRTVETHIFDFDRDIYGCDLKVEFVARLRDERRFADIDDLVAQIESDSAEARRILAEVDPAAGHRLEQVPCPFRYREVEHTADRALRVWGEELVDLFVGAARGMCGLMARVEEAGTPLLKWHEVSLESLDREGLLVDWLNELLYLTEVEGLIFCDFRIRSLSDTHLVARIGGAPGEVTGAHIKAATFHDLEIEPADGGWATVITFDV